MSSAESETRIRILEATRKLMEERVGQSVRMSDIAKAAGVSRQALYLHFASRTELLVATTHYMDQVLGLDQRLERWNTATTGEELLTTYIEFWGNYVPEIYTIAKALIAEQDTDEAAAIAWKDRLNAIREGCRHSINVLQREGNLAPGWTRQEATDFLWTMLSVHNWEQLTKQCGWSTPHYIERMQNLAKRFLVQK
jgi:AcrR family transcriptional regulator